jgi:hypothetical protein
MILLLYSRYTQFIRSTPYAVLSVVVHFTAYTLVRHAFWACNRLLHHIPTRCPLDWTNQHPPNPALCPAPVVVSGSRAKKGFEHLRSNYAGLTCHLRDHEFTWLFPLGPPVLPPWPCLTGPSPTLQQSKKSPPPLQPPGWRIPELVRSSYI